jgi:hypothetical protein
MGWQLIATEDSTSKVGVGAATLVWLEMTANISALNSAPIFAGRGLYLSGLATSVLDVTPP